MDATKYGVIVFLLMTASCVDQRGMSDVNSTALPEAVPVCEVTAHPRKYAGRDIEVVGIYGNAPHQRILFDPDCMPGHLALRISGSKESTEQDEQMQNAWKNKDRVRMRAVYRGRIEAEQKIYGCTEADCYRVAITDAKLLATEAILVP